MYVYIHMYIHIHTNTLLSPEMPEGLVLEIANLNKGGPFGFNKRLGGGGALFSVETVKHLYSLSLFAVSWSPDHLSCACVITCVVCFITPILWNRYGPEVSSKSGQGARVIEMDRLRITSLFPLKEPGVARTSPSNLTTSLPTPSPN